MVVAAGETEGAGEFPEAAGPSWVDTCSVAVPVGMPEAPGREVWWCDTQV